MGYMFLMADCFACGKMFTSNPDYVPSIQNNPVCEDCVKRANVLRREMGLEPHFIHPRAYTPEWDGVGTPERAEDYD